MANVCRNDAVFEVSVALLCGAILHANADGEKSWGVISCRDALGAFDPRSEAWCGRDGVPHRFTFDEAEARARRMTGSSHDGESYSALEIPSRPIRATVGPFAVAGSPPGSAFACLTWGTGPGDVIETGDNSAFGAACAFVDLVGVEAADRALRDLSEV